MEKGALIGRGRTARIYKWGDKEVIKLFEKDFNQNTIKNEFSISKIIYNTGIRIPYAKEIIDMNGQLGIVYEYIEGDTIMKLLYQRIFSITVYARIFARLQAQMHTNKSAELPDIKVRLENSIKKTDTLTEEKKQKILNILKELPSGNTVCHSDFHPDNIIKTKNGYTIIDWTNAVSGCAAADVAITSMSLTVGMMPPGKPKTEIILADIVRKKFNNEYLREYLRISNLSMNDIKAWELPVLAARLNSNVPQEKGILLGRINKLLDEKNSAVKLQA
jgi:uncharacterized protein (TIGR02172 family)